MTGRSAAPRQLSSEFGILLAQVCELVLKLEHGWSGCRRSSYGRRRLFGNGVHAAARGAARLERVELRAQLDHQILDMLKIVPTDFNFAHQRLVLDVSGSIGIFESVDGFVEIVFCRADARDKERPGVATERILKQAGELGVSVRDVGGIPGFLRIAQC